MLVERYLKGDQQAFQALYERYYERVLSIARGILLDPDEAADAAQEIFTLVARHLPRFDGRSKFSTWLVRIAINRSIQQGRSYRFRHKNLPLSEATDRAAEDSAPEPADPRVTASMSKLSPTDRAILALFYWDELSLNEVADAMGCTVNAAKTRLFRARERFKTLYEAVE